MNCNIIHKLYIGDGVGFGVGFGVGLKDLFKLKLKLIYKPQTNFNAKASFGTTKKPPLNKQELQYLFKRTVHFSTSNSCSYLMIKVKVKKEEK